MAQTRSALRRANWRVVLLASALLFASSFVTPLEVRVFVEGTNVSQVLGRGWSVLTGVATLVSSLLTARNYYDQRESESSSESTAGPDTSIRFGNIEGDVNVVVDEPEQVGARETAPEDERGEADAEAGRVDAEQKSEHDAEQKPERDAEQKSESDADGKRNAKN